jgi:hypothetical protein
LPSGKILAVICWYCCSVPPGDINGHGDCHRGLLSGPDWYMRALISP